MTFPENFAWGTTSSATPSEGAAPTSTWRRWEDLGRAPRSGEGNGFATNYADDFRMFGEFGLTHHRLSIDWARIEPVEGKVDPAAIEHMTEVLRTARQLGIEIWACLHDISLPGWFAVDMGGLVDDRDRTYYWARHVERMAETFGDLVHAWIPVNEPTAYAYGGWSVGELPPGVTEPRKFAEALRAVHLAGLDAWKILRGGDKPVATAMNVSPVYPAVRSREPDERDLASALAETYDTMFTTSWIRAIRDGILAIPGLPEEEIPAFVDAFDLIGFTYTNAWSVYADRTFGPYPTDARVGLLGYAPWAEGLGIVIRRLRDELPNRPLLVAGCGVGTDHSDPREDEWRVAILRDSLHEVERAIDDGIDVRGFFHRSGVDAYEWTKGDTVDFGLFDRDRVPKASARLARDWAHGATEGSGIG